MNNNKGPTLLIMAAGLGSRYGGVKQLDLIGPGGECIMEYSIFDAIKAGFEKLVFVIKKSFEKDFKEKISSKWEKFIEIEHVFQELEDLPGSFCLPKSRQKPWGTGHAILTARNSIQEPFTVINADDFYGREAFKVIADQLIQKNAPTDEHCLVAYQLQNTLSAFGSVSRGICTVKDNYLTSINEATHISKSNDVIYNESTENRYELSGKTLVSMNFWGFRPGIFEIMMQEFEQFLINNSNNPKAEFFIAYPLDKGLQNNQFSIKVLETTEKWMGVTYQNDKKFIQSGIMEKINKSIYPINLHALD